MRLLRVQNDGTFSLVQYYSDIPPYAILSHTWGPDDEEVVLKDIVEKTGASKPGYAKLLFCAQQAAKDGLDYIWVDTCCIDKTSSAELSEAINSMFRWYQNSVVCYVYLADIRISEYNADSRCFRKSRWLTRGWTLQELLAPRRVEFFTADAQLIGNRDTLLSSIVETTGISDNAFRGYPLQLFTITERLLWAKGRFTKRKEDFAYSLLGIFNVHMPLIYGEGPIRALSRLLYETDVYETRHYGKVFKVLRGVVSKRLMYWLYAYGHRPSLYIDTLGHSYGIDIPVPQIVPLIYVFIIAIGSRYRVVDLTAVFSDIYLSTLGVLSFSIVLCWHIGKSAVHSLETGALAFATMNIIYLCVLILFTFWVTYHTQSPSSPLSELFMSSNIVSSLCNDFSSCLLLSLSWMFLAHF